MFGFISKKEHNKNISDLRNEFMQTIADLTREVNRLKTLTKKAVVPVDVKDKVSTSVNSRLIKLETLLPDLNFIDNNNNTISVNFNGVESVVRVVTKRTSERANGWGFTKVNEGDVLVLCNEDSLYGVCIARKDWMTSKGTIWIADGTAKAIAVKMNTPKVLRNFN